MVRHSEIVHNYKYQSEYNRERRLLLTNTQYIYGKG